MDGMKLSVRKAFRHHPLAGRMCESSLLCTTIHCPAHPVAEKCESRRFSSAISSSYLLCATQAGLETLVLGPGGELGQVVYVWRAYGGALCIDMYEKCRIPFHAGV